MIKPKEEKDASKGKAGAAAPINSMFPGPIADSPTLLGWGEGGRGTPLRGKSVALGTPAPGTGGESAPGCARRAGRCTGTSARGRVARLNAAPPKVSAPPSLRRDEPAGPRFFPCHWPGGCSALQAAPGPAGAVERGNHRHGDAEPGHRRCRRGGGCMRTPPAPRWGWAPTRLALRGGWRHAGEGVPAPGVHAWRGTVPRLRGCMQVSLSGGACTGGSAPSSDGPPIPRRSLCGVTCAQGCRGRCDQ